MARSAPGTSRTFNSGVWFTPKRPEIGQEPPGLAAAGSRVTDSPVAYDHQVPLPRGRRRTRLAPPWPRLARGRVFGCLQLQLGMNLRADQNDVERNVKPEQQDDDGAKRSAKLIVGGEFRYVESEKPRRSTKPPWRRESPHSQRLRSDASLRAHLTALADATELLRTSFDALLEEAPRARLYAAFAAALSKSPRRAKYQLREMLLAAAAALLLLIGGGVAGYFIAKAPLELFEEADAFEEAWIDAVAGQLSLYEGTAVASIPVNEAEQQAQLSKLGEELKLDLSQPRVMLEGLTLKRAELLNFQGRKVAQLLWGLASGHVVLPRRSP